MSHKVQEIACSSQCAALMHCHVTDFNFPSFLRLWIFGDRATQMSASSLLVDLLGPLRLDIILPYAENLFLSSSAN